MKFVLRHANTEKRVFSRTLNLTCQNIHFMFEYFYHIMDLMPIECTNVDILSYSLENLCPCEKSRFSFL